MHLMKFQRSIPRLIYNRRTRVSVNTSKLFKSNTVKKSFYFQKVQKVGSRTVSCEYIETDCHKVCSLLDWLWLFHTTNTKHFYTHSKDRTQWACKICVPTEFRDFIKHNLLRHYLSVKKHCACVVATAQNGLQRDMDKKRKTKVYTENLVTILVDDTIITSVLLQESHYLLPQCLWCSITQLERSERWQATS